MYSVNDLQTMFKTVIIFFLCVFSFNLFFIMNYESFLEANEIVDPENGNQRLCYKHWTNASCLYQLNLPENENNSCQYFKLNNTSPDCGDEYFKNNKNTIDNLGDVLLTTFIEYLNEFPSTALNVTFTNIRWKYLRYRFYENGSTVPSNCREFKLSSSLIINQPNNYSLFSDCVWKRDIETKTYVFQYKAFSEFDEQVSQKYVFFVPNYLYLGSKCDPCPPMRHKVLKVKDIKLFVFADVSIQPKLKFFVQLADKMYNITKYNCKLMRCFDKMAECWNVYYNTTFVHPNQTFLMVEYDTDFKPGVYNFIVTPLHESCERGICLESSAPGIVVVSELPLGFLIGCVVAVITIPLLIAAYFIGKGYFKSIPPEDPAQPPKVLLVYNPDYKKHVSDMIAFYKYLEGCHVKPLMDIFGIPNSQSKSSVCWYNEAFEEANFILVCAPPIDNEVSRHYLNTYRNLWTIGTNELRRFFSMNTIQISIGFFHWKKPLEKVGNAKIFILIFPNCDKNKIPSDVKGFKQFNIPDDSIKLMKQITKCSPTIPIQKAFLSALENSSDLSQTQPRLIISVPADIQLPINPSLPTIEDMPELVWGFESGSTNTISHSSSNESLNSVEGLVH